MILNRFPRPSLRPLLPVLLLGLSLPLTSPAMASAPGGDQPAQAATTGATPLDQLAQKQLLNYKENNMSNALAVTDATFQDEVINSDKPVVVDFWATWCPPCIREMPDLAALAREMGDQAAFLGIAADTDGNVKKFTAKNPGIDFPLVLAGYNALNLSRQWGNERGGLPFTVVLDAKGQIQWRHSGTVDVEALRSMLKSGELR